MLHALPRLERIGGKIQILADGKPLILLAGEVHNSSSSSLAYMEPIWNKAQAFHLNALLPVAWDQVEPEEGVFDFSIVDGLLKQAREYGMKIVFLWFGSWKNAASDYMPAYVKQNPDRFFRAELREGCGYTRFQKSRLFTVSPLCREARECDKRAFARFMAHLRDNDAESTVVAVQVENEVGILGAPRDMSKQATEAFCGNADERLLRYLTEHATELQPAMKRAWERGKKAGTWTDAFGSDAEEVFMAWHFADYIGDVANAGLAEYPLPLAANAWLVQYDGEDAGAYPSGGPVSRMADVWRAAAPCIGIHAPDIYLPDFREITAMYARHDNPLFIPEIRSDATAMAGALYAIGEHQAICAAPFGVEDMDRPNNIPIPDVAMAGTLEFERDSLGGPYAELMGILHGMLPMLEEAYAEPGSLRGFFREKDETECVLEFADFDVLIEYQDTRLAPSGGLVLRRGEDWYLVGYGFRACFRAKDGTGNVGYTLHEDGAFADGQWTPDRRLNGDEMQIKVFDVGVRRVKLFRY